MVLKKKGRRIRKRNNQNDGVVYPLDPLSYIESRGFLLYINCDAGLVYRYCMDDNLLLFLNLQFNMVELIYGYDFDNALYRGIPTTEDFHMVLEHVLER